MVPFEGEVPTGSGNGSPNSVFGQVATSGGNGGNASANGRFSANALVTDNALGAGSAYFSVDAWATEHGFTEDGWAEAAAAGVLQVAKPASSEKSAGLEDYVTLRRDLPEDVRAMVLQRLADAGLGTAAGIGG